MEDLRRKPLSDITNRFNLKPISDLHKLVDSTSRKCASFSKPRNLIPKANSTPRKLSLCSEESNANIGSSNVGKSTNTVTATFQTSPGTTKSKGPAYTIGNSIEKGGEDKGSSLLFVGPEPSVTWKDKGKATVAPLGSSPVGKSKADQVEILSAHCSDVSKKGIQRGVVSLSSAFVENANSSTNFEKGNSADLSSFKGMGFDRKCSTNLSSCPSRKVNVRMNEVPKPCSLSTSETMDTGTKSSSSSSSHQKTMGILQPLNVVETKNFASTSDALTVNVRSTRRKTENRKKNDSIGSFSCPPALKKSNPKDLNESGAQPSNSRTAPPKAKKKRVSPILPQYAFEKETAYFKELDAEELVIEEVSSDDVD